MAFMAEFRFDGSCDEHARRCEEDPAFHKPTSYTAHIGVGGLSSHISLQASQFPGQDNHLPNKNTELLPADAKICFIRAPEQSAQHPILDNLPEGTFLSRRKWGRAVNKLCIYVLLVENETKVDRRKAKLSIPFENPAAVTCEQQSQDSDRRL
jgi:hypothetical protein